MSVRTPSAGPDAARGVVWLIGSLGLAAAIFVAVPRWIVQVTQQSWLGAVGREAYVTGAQAASLAAETQTVTLIVAVPGAVVATLLGALGARRGLTWMRRAGHKMVAAWRVTVGQGPSAHTQALAERPRRERLGSAAITLLIGVVAVSLAGGMLFLMGREFIGLVGTRFEKAESGPGTAIALWTFLAAAVSYFVAAATAEYAPALLARARQWSRAVVS